MNYNKKFMVVLAALLALMMSVTAVAVVKGDLLRREVEVASVEVAANVTDVHVENTQDGFAVSIDEVLWEDNRLQFSYSLKAPDDGKTYLAGIYLPEINGEKQDVGRGRIIADSLVELYVMNVEYGTEFTEIIEMAVDTSIRPEDAPELKLNAAFFTIDRPLRKVENWEAFSALLTQIDDGIYGFESSDTIYYVNDEPVPHVELHYYPEAAKAIEDCATAYMAKLGKEPHAYKGNWSLAREAETVTPEALSESGLVNLAATESVAIPMNESMFNEKAFNALKEMTVTSGDYTLRIDQFRLSHLSAMFTGHISRNDGQSVPEEMCSLMLLRSDGSELAKSLSYVNGYGDAGDNGWAVDNDIRGYIDLDGVEKLLIAPASYSDDGSVTYDLDKAFVIEPTFDEAVAEANATPEPTCDPADDDKLSW